MCPYLKNGHQISWFPHFLQSLALGSIQVISGSLCKCLKYDLLNGGCFGHMIFHVWCQQAFINWLILSFSFVTGTVSCKWAKSCKIIIIGINKSPNMSVVSLYQTVPLTSIKKEKKVPLTSIKIFLNCLSYIYKYFSVCPWCTFKWKLDLSIFCLR